MDEEAQLDDLNKEQVRFSIPAMTLTALIIITGSIGNSFVIYNYLKYFRYSYFFYFILSLAFCDLLVCTVALPMDLYSGFKKLIYRNVISCKIFRYIQNTTIMGSVFILEAIAVMRYNKIFRPLHFRNRAKTRVMCIFSLGLSAGLNFPCAIFLFGISRPITRVRGLRGYNCNMDEEKQKSVILKLYNTAIIVIFLTVMATLTFIYARLGRYFSTHRKKLGHKISVDRIHRLTQMMLRPNTPQSSPRASLVSDLTQGLPRLDASQSTTESGAVSDAVDPTLDSSSGISSSAVSGPLVLAQPLEQQTEVVTQMCTQKDRHTAWKKKTSKSKGPKRASISSSKVDLPLKPQDQMPTTAAPRRNSVVKDLSKKDCSLNASDLPDPLLENQPPGMAQPSQQQADSPQQPEIVSRISPEEEKIPESTPSAGTSDAIGHDAREKDRRESDGPEGAHSLPNRKSLFDVNLPWKPKGSVFSVEAARQNSVVNGSDLPDTLPENNPNTHCEHPDSNLPEIVPIIPGVLLISLLDSSRHSDSVDRIPTTDTEVASPAGNSNKKALNIDLKGFVERQQSAMKCTELTRSMGNKSREELLNSSERKHKSEGTVTHALTVITVVFFCCHISIIVVIMSYEVLGESDPTGFTGSHLARTIFYFMLKIPFIQSATNPIIYVLFNSLLRKRITHQLVSVCGLRSVTGDTSQGEKSSLNASVDIKTRSQNIPSFVRE